MKQATPRITCVGHTNAWQSSMKHAVPNWECDGWEGPALVEFSGRACYQSWTRPNPATATNAGYIRHILEVGHFSVLEHGNVSFYFEGVSRSFTHELVRHRHLSFSQLSQRYVNELDASMVVPGIIAEDEDLLAMFRDATNAAQDAYASLVELLDERLAMVPELSKTDRRKKARQAARSVLPNATETRIVVTGNYRAWRHFIDLRANEHADEEICDIAIEVLRKLRLIAPPVFADYEITMLPDGTEIASTPYREVS